MKLPKEFEERMKALLGDEYSDFADAMDTPPVRALRVNTLKYTPEELEKSCSFRLEKLPFCKEGYIFEGEHIGTDPLHCAGAIYVQEPAAMTALECVEITPKMKLLDVCSAPGGKTTQAAAKLCGQGVIVSNEIDGKRCRVLAQNIERLGVRNAVITNTDSKVLGETYREEFDLVIVDAPCSGEGMMRKNPLAVSEWSMDNIRRCAERQSEILQNIAHTVKRGGKLLYSTCTFAPEENEMQMARFLSEHADFHLIPVSERVEKATSDGLAEFGEEMKLCRRFYPHVSKGEGQFMALLQRDGECESTHMPKAESKRGKNGKESSKKKKNTADDTAVAVIKDFLADVLTEEGVCETENYTLTLSSDGNFYLACNIDVPRETRSVGVAVGSVQKGRVIPHHNFFTAYGSLFKRQIRLDIGDARVLRYLHGESIETELENGFAAVLIGGAAVGGAKISGGEAKNYYPKGLRI